LNALDRPSRVTLDADQVEQSDQGPDEVPGPPGLERTLRGIGAGERQFPELEEQQFCEGERRELVATASAGGDSASALTASFPCAPIAEPRVERRPRYAWAFGMSNLAICSNLAARRRTVAKLRRGAVLASILSIRRPDHESGEWPYISEPLRKVSACRAALFRPEPAVPALAGIWQYVRRPSKTEHSNARQAVCHHWLARGAPCERSTAAPEWSDPESRSSNRGDPASNMPSRQRAV